MILLPALILIALAFALVFWLYPAFQFLRQYEQKLKSASAITPPEEITLPDVQIHIYRPPKNQGTTLIVVPGLHPSGIRDPRFIAFAETCARAGFLVIAPDIAEFRNFIITSESLRILRSVVNALPKIIPADQRQRLGILGISYGAGPVFLVAAEQKFDFIVSVGGYYNLLHALKYSFTGSHEGGQRRQTHEWTRLIFAFQHVRQLADQNDEEVLRQSIALRLQLKEKEAEALEQKLSREGKSLIEGILNGLSEEQKTRFNELLDLREKDALALSPQSSVSRIDRSTKVFLIHGTTDEAIPFEETLELNRAFEQAGVDSRCLLTPALSHADLKSVSGMWESLKLLHWQRQLMAETN